MVEVDWLIDEKFNADNMPKAVRGDEKVEFD